MRYIAEPLVNIEFSQSEEYMLTLSTIACKNDDECVNLWSLKDAKIIASFEDAEFVMFPEGEYLRVKKVGQGYELLTLPSLTKSDMPFPLSDARLFSPDFSLFATTDAEYLTKLWNTDNFASRGQFIAGSISLQPYL